MPKLSGSIINGVTAHVLQEEMGETGSASASGRPTFVQPGGASPSAPASLHFPARVLNIISLFINYGVSVRATKPSLKLKPGPRPWGGSAAWRPTPISAYWDS